LFSKFNFTSNIYLLNSNLIPIDNGMYILFRIFYWFLVILFLYTIGILLIRKTDFKFHS
jgi:hypothetical protein